MTHHIANTTSWTNEELDRIDAAYRAKYGRYAASIIDSINSPQARSTTLKLVPRS